MNYRQMNNQNTRNNTACPKCPCMAATLEKAGVDTTNYLSLRINKADLPANAELIVQLRDKKTGQLIPVNLNDENSLLGKNSQFYGQVMADGHIFNPMIHRRFIAKQFRELVRRYGAYNLHEAVQKTYNWKYAIDMVSKEVHKLAMLERHDKQAFTERSQFFTLDAVSRIMTDYVCEVNQSIDLALLNANPKSSSVYIDCLGSVQRQHIRPTKHRFETMCAAVSECRSYAQLDDLLQSFQFCELSKRKLLPRSFTAPFIECGAYYTMKHAIMFDGKILYNQDQAASLQTLRSTGMCKRPNACMMLYQSGNF